MPQLDTEIFIEYFFWIFLVLLNFHSDWVVSENFFRLNVRFYLYSFFIKTSKMFFLEKEWFNSLILQQLQKVVNKQS